MMRVESIELKNFKNVEAGRVDILDTQSGAGIVGIYGQNGSGKTSVVDAFDCIQRAMLGVEQADNSGDYVGASGDELGVTIRFVTAGMSGNPEEYAEIQYEMRCRTDKNNRLRITSEAIRIKPEDGQKRTLIEYKPARQDDDSSDDAQRRVRAGEYAPKARWKSILAFDEDARLLFTLAEGASYAQGASFLFAHEFSSAMGRFQKACLGSSGQFRPGVPATVREALEKTVHPLSRVIATLSYFALKNLRVISTVSTLAVSANVLHLSTVEDERHKGIPRFLPLDISGPVDLSVQDSEVLSHTVDTINGVLRALVPGYELRLRDLGSVVLNAGNEGRRLELMSVRDGVELPFRRESEGIQKITAITALLIDVYNNPESCVVVDELDSGVFEFLLGELLEVLSSRGKGQLIFTAHNLRALETLPAKCLVFTTTNPKKRFVRFKGHRPSNNLRDQYLRAINLGGQDENVYEQTDRFEIDSAFYRAGHKGEPSFDELLAQVKG
ncbi:AAA family ATPase [Collinsella ihumii]|uniref:AAA family ATPase n=1 Tax=Collinsella ihumii TaxID=1720204 RepID=A0AAW7K2V1_9ACTN|nr:AAA family ATPase [Collinsella ihumii]MDN0069532.1 AAA family ATPase [Collinsella ihumii]